MLSYDTDSPLDKSYLDQNGMHTIYKNSKDSTWIIHVHSIGQIFKIPGNPTLDKSTIIHFHTLNSFSTKTHVKIKTK